MVNKKSQTSMTIALDFFGFLLLVIGGFMIRFSKDEIMPIVGGIIIALGVGILSITRLIK